MNWAIFWGTVGGIATVLTLVYAIWRDLPQVSNRLQNLPNRSCQAVFLVLLDALAMAFIHLIVGAFIGAFFGVLIGLLVTLSPSGGPKNSDPINTIFITSLIGAIAGAWYIIQRYYWWICLFSNEWDSFCNSNLIRIMNVIATDDTLPSRTELGRTAREGWTTPLR